nr:hypothetical protein SHINE37_43479 [Rhizobiaceae bacterium]
MTGRAPPHGSELSVIRPARASTVHASPVRHSAYNRQNGAPKAYTSHIPGGVAFWRGSLRRRDGLAGRPDSTGLPVTPAHGLFRHGG